MKNLDSDIDSYNDKYVEKELKENEEYLKMKENEFIQRKNESKLKAMNDLHNKISQYKSERLKKKQQQQDEQDDDNNNTPTNTNIIVTE